MDRDLFLCHAHADKQSYVRPLASELRKWGVTLWVDEAEIRIGDSITAKVSDGLARSRYAVVFVTEQFLASHWPRFELQSALGKEADSGKVAVLPIVSISHEVFVERFPLLRDKLYLRWTNDLPQMTRAILDAIEIQFEQHWTHFFPVEYQGPVWLRFFQVPDNTGLQHQYKLRWGPWRCEETFVSSEATVCLTMTKGPDSIAVPLYIEISPKCNLIGGVGTPPCNESIDLNYSWHRV